MARQSSILPQALVLAAVAAAYIFIRRDNQTNPIPSMLNDYRLPRGYRNNNPCNIIYSAGNNWKGKVANNTDGHFEQFSDMAYGYRAALTLLRGDGYIRGGNDTIRKIITKFAPDNENDTAKYISDVSAMTGMDPDTPIARNDRDSLMRIVYAMSVVENGTTYRYKDPATGQYYTTDLMQDYNLPNMEIINEAWKML